MSDQSEAPNQHSVAPEPVVHTAGSVVPEGGITPKKKSEAETWLELGKTILYAGLIALGIRTLLFQPFNIPSPSMEETLLVGDYLFVEKFAYGYSRYSIPFGKYLPGFGRILYSPAKRGDVVVFKLPSDNSTDYIKRVIGLPGDHIQMKGGHLFINDKEVPKVRVDDYVEGSGETLNNVPRYRETTPEGVNYLTLDRRENDIHDDTEIFTVPADHYFMMGDNRDNSLDSRISPENGGVGYVPAENLVGKAQVRFFSVDGSGTWYKPWTWPMAIRFSRMFTFIR
jgi:signal peptidase I